MRHIPNVVIVVAKKKKKTLWPSVDASNPAKAATSRVRSLLILIDWTHKTFRPSFDRKLLVVP